MGLSVLILAAGQGKRMHSALPKVLHPVGGRPMVSHVLSTARALTDEDRITIIDGHGGEALRAALVDTHVQWCRQVEQWGTGHAVALPLDGLPADDAVLVLYGDVPLITADTLARLAAALEDRALVLLTTIATDPSGYGRILRDDQARVTRIVEEKDAGEAELGIQEVNSGILAGRARDLKRWLATVGNDNAQSEYYLTDCIERAVLEGGRVHAHICADPDEVTGVNDKPQLARVERAYQARQAGQLMRQGVTLTDPARLDIRGELQCGRDVRIDINVIIEGRVTLGDNVTIGAHCVLCDTAIEADTDIQPYSHINAAHIGRRCVIGPFARIRPRTRLAEGVHIGNFVEVKQSTIGGHSKVNHLSYIGDTEMGARVNIGAGTITCNYDGAAKYQTTFGDDVFIGSDTQLIAPVAVGEGATVGAGSTITRDAPAGELTLSRSRQATIKGWQRPVKKA